MKKNLLNTIISALCISILLNSTVYAGAVGEISHITDEQYDFNKDCNYIIAVDETSKWIAKVNANNINSAWEVADQFTYVNFSYGDEFYFDNSNTLIMPFSNSDDYTNGAIAQMLFHNLTKNEYGAIYINFSESGILTFLSPSDRDMVIGDGDDKYILLPWQGDINFVTDNKQELNKENLAPEEIILTDDNPDKLGAIKNHDGLPFFRTNCPNLLNLFQGIAIIGQKNTLPTTVRVLIFQKLLVEQALSNKSLGEGHSLIDAKMQPAPQFPHPPPPLAHASLLP